MRHILALITVLLLPLTCFARLGETKEQLDSRYGKPVKENVGQTTTYTYQKNGYELWFLLINGKAEVISVRHTFNNSLTASEINLFLSKNSLNKGFELFRTLNGTDFYYEAESNRHAFYDQQRAELTIRTPRAMQQYIEEIKSIKKDIETEEKTNTSGF